MTLLTDDIQSPRIGPRSSVWQFCLFLSMTGGGTDCNLCIHALIEKDECVSDRVASKTRGLLRDEVIAKENITIPPDVTFTNNVGSPTSQSLTEGIDRATIQKGASIGINTAIEAGYPVGAYTLIETGSIAIKNALLNRMRFGIHMVHHGYMTDDGVLLDMNKKEKNGTIHKLDTI